MLDKILQVGGKMALYHPNLLGVSSAYDASNFLFNVTVVLEQDT